MEIFVLLCRAVLGAVFLVAGLAKLADLPGSRKSMVDFGAPKALAPAFGLLLPLWEIAIGLALFPSATAWRAGIGAFALLLLFIAGIIYNLALGRTPDCHCFGKLHSAPIGFKTIARNAIFCAIAAGIIGQGAQQPTIFGWTEHLSRTQLLIIFGGGIQSILLIIVFWMLVSMLRQNGRMLLRIETLESQLKPKPRIPAGDFKGQRTVFLFWNPGCSFCLKMLDDVKAWEGVRAKNALRLVIVSSGTVEQTKAQGFQSTIVHGVGTEGTPSAVLADQDGNIVSNIAVGADEVLGLMKA